MEDNKCCNLTTNNYYGCCGNGTGTALHKEVYSFEELEIGTWVDGKPIYRKVIEGKLANANGNDIVFADVSDLDIYRIIGMYGNFISTDGGGIIYPISFVRTQGQASAVTMYYHVEKKKIQYHLINNSGSYYGVTAFVVLEYIKQDNTMD